jgi:hypothetical protein
LGGNLKAVKHPAFGFLPLGGNKTAIKENGGLIQFIHEFGNQGAGKRGAGNNNFLFIDGETVNP